MIALPTVPTQVLAGNVYVMTQGTGASSINDSLAQNLTREPWAGLVSPEVFALGTLEGTPVVVRGADASVFVRMEGGQWTQGGSAGPGWAVAGASLRDRLGLSFGQYVTLAGSSIPRLAVASIAGFFRSNTAADDELVVDLSLARFLTGVPAGVYHSIRVETADPAALLSFLSSRGASVHVTGPGGAAGRANTESATDPRLINLFLRYGQGTLPLDYLTEGLNEATNSVRVVSLGLIALLGLLVAFGVHAVQARAFEDRKAAMGVLRAIGAGGNWIRARIFLETLPLAILAGVVGAALGFLLASVLAPTSTLRAFGHVVRASFDPLTFLGLVAFVVAVSVLSELLLIGRTLKDRPGESIRESAGTEVPPSLEAVLRG